MENEHVAYIKSLPRTTEAIKKLDLSLELEYRRHSHFPPPGRQLYIVMRWILFSSLVLFHFSRIRLAEIAE